MSIADLKARMTDVPGIETLSMALKAGGYRSDGERALRLRSMLRLPMRRLRPIRNAIKIPPVS
jgi:hypothetical protein